MFLISIAVVVALIAWLMIPRKPGGTKPPDAGPPAVFAWPTGHAPVGPVGPFQASVEEKMAVVESELRARQADKYRKQVIEEVADLVSTSSKAK
jgi:hypothetical protein